MCRNTTSDTSLPDLQPRPVLVRSRFTMLHPPNVARSLLHHYGHLFIAQQVNKFRATSRELPFVLYFSISSARVIIHLVIMLFFFNRFYSLVSRSLSIVLVLFWIFAFLPANRSIWSHGKVVTINSHRGKDNVYNCEWLQHFERDITKGNNAIETSFSSSTNEPWIMQLTVFGTKRMIRSSAIIRLRFSLTTERVEDRKKEGLALFTWNL